MSIIHLNRIKKHLEIQVLKFIDTEYIKESKFKMPKEEEEAMILSQAFALYSTKSLCDESYNVLSNFITDDFQDNGIDLVFYSEQNNVLSLVQSKWIRSGFGGVDKADILKFIKGVKDILHLDFSHANDKLKRHSQILEKAICDSNIKINIVLAYSGTQLSKENLEIIKDEISEFNDVDDVIFFTEFNLVKAYEFLKLSIEGEPINTELEIHNWGITEKPLKCIYGTIYCGQIAELFESNQRRIFSKNIRAFIGESEINSGIVSTLVKNPENFVYLNNGITLLCKTIRKSPYGASDRHLGKFSLTDLTIINGAQTVGSINTAFKRNAEKVNEAKLFVKIISLENCPNDFDKEVTIASNTQNKIEKRDFISLDFQQERIKNEFLISGLNYHIKRDDKKILLDDNNFYLEEATVALACFDSDVDYSTYVKREIGKLWENTSSKPYTALFNEKLKPHKLINLIKIIRDIENFIKINSLYNQDDKLIGTHGLYFIMHLHMQNIDKTFINDPNYDIIKYLSSDFKLEIDKLVKRTVITYNQLFKNKFPLSVFKNFNFCRMMKDEILLRDGKPKPGQTLYLFEELS